MSKIKAIIVDWAGTVVDYGCMAPAAVFVEVYKKQGINISMPDARGPMGMNKRDHIAAIANLPHVAEAWQKKNGNPISDADISAMYEAFIPMQLDCIKDYSELIPGTLEMTEYCKKNGIKIGSTTGYNTAMLKKVLERSEQEGFVPDTYVTGDDVPVGRPAPWMCYLAAMRMNIYPMHNIIKIGDTVPDILEGLNAGMWSVGVTMTGNEVGMSHADVEALPKNELEKLLEKAELKLNEAGAHYVISTIAELPVIIEEINKRLANGEKP